MPEWDRLIYDFYRLILFRFSPGINVKHIVTLTGHLALPGRLFRGICSVFPTFIGFDRTLFFCADDHLQEWETGTPGQEIVSHVANGYYKFIFPGSEQTGHIVPGKRAVGRHIGELLNRDNRTIEPDFEGGFGGDFQNCFRLIVPI